MVLGTFIQIIYWPEKLIEGNCWASGMILLKHNCNVSLIIIRYIYIYNHYCYKRILKYTTNGRKNILHNLFWKTFQEKSPHTGASKLTYNANGRFLYQKICAKKVLPNNRSRGVLRKRCSENMQQIYRRIAMSKCDFNKVALQLYWNHTSAWVFSCKFAAHFQNTFS